MNSRNILIAGILAALIVLGLWIATPTYLNWRFPGYYNEATRGQYGDMYGATTSLFTGFTIIGLIITILLQREDINIGKTALEHQKEEITLSRETIKLATEEMANSKKSIENSTIELKRQRRLLKSQKFDNTFFNLLKLTLEIIVETKSATFESAVARQKMAFSGKTTKDEMLGDYRRNVADHVDEKLTPYALSMSYLLEYVCKEQNTEGLKKYLPLIFSQFRKTEKEYLFFYFNIQQDHPYYNLFEEFLITYPCSQDVHNARNKFNEWRKLNS